jgi:hypothetical protein
MPLTMDLTTKQIEVIVEALDTWINNRSEEEGIREMTEEENDAVEVGFMLWKTFRTILLMKKERENVG